MTGIAARPALRVLGEHPSLDRAEVPEKIAEGELAVAVCPVDLLRRHDRGDTQGALADRARSNLQTR